MSIDYFRRECIRAANLIRRYQDQISERFSQAEISVVSREFSSGGEMLPRGFYCPSMILDIIAGNVKRGKLISPGKHEKTPTYVYGFDERDRLVTVLWGNEREIIWYEGAVETGIAFREVCSENFISYLCECEYEGNRIASYAVYIYHPFEQSIAHMTRETYSYGVNHMSVEVAQFSNVKPWILQKDKFVFSIKNGCLTEYRSKNVSGNIMCYPIRNRCRIPTLTDDGPFKRYHADKK